MADKEEIESQQPPDPETVKNPATAEVDEKEKKKKPRKPKTATHPPYFQMIKEALLALNEKSGSSPYAIAKFIEGKHKSVLPENFRKTLALKLKNSASKGKLVKIRASYKLSSETTKKARPAATTTRTTRQMEKKKKQEETKTTRRRTRSTSTRAKTMSLNKPEVATKKKRSGTRKAKPRQPRSIKSPAAQKAMKASAST